MTTFPQQKLAAMQSTRAASLDAVAVTFVLSDIEGSTRLWEEHPDAMRVALARHDALLREAVEGTGGRLVKSTGDGMLAAFTDAGAAVSAAVRAQAALLVESWPAPVAIRARIGIHTGPAESRDGDFYGPTLNRAARIMAAGHGGQTLLSAAAAAAALDIGGAAVPLPDGCSLRDLGQCRLRDLSGRERVFQVCHPGLPDAFPPLRSLDRTPNNLPQPAAGFVGRDTEMAEMRRLLSGTRLLTLTGAGGCGKTRLALQAAAEMLDAYPDDGVWFVDLAPLTDPALVARAAADALSLREEQGRPLAQTLAAALRPRKTLLILDNCEHVIDEAARLADSLLRSCPDVTVLATSRERLRVGGEVVFRVPSLSLPAERDEDGGADGGGGDNDLSLEGLARYESVRLFLDRAAAAAGSASFAVARASTGALARVCRRLDGIPLAIELAAARTRALPLEEIDRRLDDRFRLLTAGSRAALPRQQTLKALVDWSWDLLDARERRLLCRLSVFAGGWTLEAAEAVCAGGEVEDWEVLDLLSGLVDKSLALRGTEGAAGGLTPEAADAPGPTGAAAPSASRFRLLETVRQYARQRFAEYGADEARLAEDRHRDFFRTLAEREAPGWEAVLHAERNNLRAALAVALADPSERGAVDALRIAAAMGRYWGLRGSLEEGSARLADALAHPAAAVAPDADRARALLAAADLDRRRGAIALAESRLVEAEAVAAAAGDGPLAHEIAAGVLHGRATQDTDSGALDRAAERYRAAIDLCLQGGWTAADRQRAVALGNLGRVAFLQGDVERATALYAEERDLQRAVGDRQGEVRCDLHLGMMALQRQQFDEAESLLRAALEAAREMGDRPLEASALLTLGNAASYRSSPDDPRPLEEMIEYTRQSLVLFRATGERMREVNALNNLGDGLMGLGRLSEARDALERALCISQDLNNARYEGLSLSNLGLVELRTGRLDAAAEHFAHALRVKRASGSAPVPVAQSLEDLAALAEARREDARSVRLFAAADRLRVELDFPLPPDDAAEHALRLEASKRRLGEEAYAAEWAAGRALGRDAAVAYALGEADGHAAP